MRKTSFYPNIFRKTNHRPPLRVLPFHQPISRLRELELTCDVARPLSYKTKTTYFFKTKIAFFKDHQIINPKIINPRPQKVFPYRKKSCQLSRFCPVMPELCRLPKKPAFYRLSSQVLLHPKLGS